MIPLDVILFYEKNDEANRGKKAKIDVKVNGKYQRKLRQIIQPSCGLSRRARNAHYINESNENQVKKKKHILEPWEGGL